MLEERIMIGTKKQEAERMISVWSGEYGQNINSNSFTNPFARITLHYVNDSTGDDFKQNILISEFTVKKAIAFVLTHLISQIITKNVDYIEETIDKLLYGLEITSGIEDLSKEYDLRNEDISVDKKLKLINNLRYKVILALYNKAYKNFKISERKSEDVIDGFIDECRNIDFTSFYFNGDASMKYFQDNTDAIIKYDVNRTATLFNTFIFFTSLTQLIMMPEAEEESNKFIRKSFRQYLDNVNMMCLFYVLLQEQQMLTGTFYQGNSFIFTDTNQDNIKQFQFTVGMQDYLVSLKEFPIMKSLFVLMNQLLKYNVVDETNYRRIIKRLFNCKAARITKGPLSEFNQKCLERFYYCFIEGNGDHDREYKINKKFLEAICKNLMKVELEVLDKLDIFAKLDSLVEEKESMYKWVQIYGQIHLSFITTMLKSNLDELIEIDPEDREDIENIQKLTNEFLEKNKDKFYGYTDFVIHTIDDIYE